MANEMTRANTGGLAALASLRTGLAQVRATVSASVGGQPLLRLLKDGDWVIGREDNAVVAGTEGIVNPNSFMTGYSCWTDRKPGMGKNEMMGEEMWGIGNMVPPASTMPTHHDPRTQDVCRWNEQMSVDIKLLDGPFQDQQVLYKTTSVGGRRALSSLLDAILAAIDKGTDYVCPIISIKADSYNHNSYGRTYVPVLEIVGWADMMGNEEENDGAPAAVDKAVKAEPKPEPKVEPVQAEAPAGRRRRV